MNPATKILAFAIMGILLSAPAWAASKYGSANIEKGKITVLREGSRLTYKQGDGGVEINHLDVIRVGRDSNVVLDTVEKATITLGSNAVFQVKPWQRKEEKGFFRMLFGRMRAKVAVLGGTERFNVHTATATIGVKGTEYTALLNAQGDATVGCTESVITLRGLAGGELSLPQGIASAVVGGITPRRTFSITPAFQNLNSAPPNSNVALQVPLAQVLINQNVVTEEQVEASESGASEGVDLPEQASDTASDAVGQDILDDQEAGAQDSANESSEITLPISIQF